MATAGRWSGPHAGLYTVGELKSSPAYNEAPRLGSCQDSVKVRLHGPDGTRIAWNLGDPADSDGWGTSRIPMVRRLAPHVRQFVCLRQALVHAEARAATVTGLLDSSRVGSFIWTGADGSWSQRPRRRHPAERRRVGGPGRNAARSRARLSTVDDDGLVRAVAAEFAGVSPEYQGLRASLLAKSGLGPDVPVWWLMGMVRDAETRRGLWGATVQVRDGIFAGVSDETGSTGMYELRDVARRLRIDVERDGYEGATAVVEMTSPAMLNFDLIPVDEGP